MSKRLFIAIPIQPEKFLIKQRAFLQSNLSEEKINWVKEENMHLTLKFLGKTSLEHIPAIIDALNLCLKNRASFPMIIEGIGIFGSSYNARVVWAGIRENIQLQKLQACILEELEKAGFAVDRQNFVPHFTLGRIKKIHHKDHFKRVMESVEIGIVQEVIVDGFVLFESILTNEGPIYKTIKRFEF